MPKENKKAKASKGAKDEQSIERKMEKLTISDCK